MPTLAHWDEVERFRAARGHLASFVTPLAKAAGTRGVGVNRIEIEPARWSTPVHRQTAEEEIFFVLAGSGICLQDDVAYEVRAGDCIVHLAGRETHSLRAGPGGLDVLAFGTRSPTEIGHLPRAGVAWLARTWVEVGVGDDPWEREVAAGEPEVPEPSKRPPNVVNVDELEARYRERGEFAGVGRRLGASAGSVRTGLNQAEIWPGKLNAPPHCHSAEEEIFVVLDGEGTLLLEDEEHPVRRGHVVARPPGTRVAHAFRAGERGLTLLAYGTREPNDITYYPRSDKVFLRGVGVIGRIERLDYWDGEL